MDEKKILIVDDEQKMLRFIELELKYEGYKVVTANNGRDAYEIGKGDDIDLIILDLMLPQLSGTEVCRRLRKISDIPIIMLTAKDDISDKINGLDIGADDYMTKPFEIEELLARMRVLLKRKYVNRRGISSETGEFKSEDSKDMHSDCASVVDDDKCLCFQGLSLNRESFIVKYKENVVELTKKEFDLLEYLLSNKNIVLTREKIINKVWGYDYYGDTNVIDVYIRYLRSKIDQKFGVCIIETVRGVGYTIRD